MKRLLKGFDLAWNGHVLVDQELSDINQIIFYVNSGTVADERYMVCYLEGNWICDCHDFKIHFKNIKKGEFGSFNCKHINACISHIIMVELGNIHDKALELLIMEVRKQFKSRDRIKQIN